MAMNSQHRLYHADYLVTLDAFTQETLGAFSDLRVNYHDPVAFVHSGSIGFPGLDSLNTSPFVRSLPSIASDINFERRTYGRCIIIRFKQFHGFRRQWAFSFQKGDAPWLAMERKRIEFFLDRFRLLWAPKNNDFQLDDDFKFVPRVGLAIVATGLPHPTLDDAEVGSVRGINPGADYFNQPRVM